jgi:serine protease inhibitor
MRNQGRILSGAVAVALLAAGCASAQAAPPPPKVSHGVPARVPAADARPYGAADTAFGLDVLRAWCQADPGGNLVFSPASLATGLGMAYLGARGATASAMASVLSLPLGDHAAGAADPAADPAADRALLAGLRARTAALAGLDGPGVTVAASNQLWADPSLPTRQSYLNALATAYQAGVARVSLLKDPDQAARQINQSISAATQGQIPSLVTPSMLQQIGWVLTSALYLHADWATPFEASLTQPGTFTTAGTTTGVRDVTANFMNGHGYQVGTADGWTGVTLPYQGDKLAMVALLPPAGDVGASTSASASSCSTPSPATVAAIAGHGTSGSVALPKISLRTDTSMNQLLTRLGMGNAFGGSADFSGLSPEAGNIGFVQQATTLTVGEKGTVAASATAVGIVATALPAGPRVTFDRPYLLLVTSTATGDPLFLARVANPAAG